MKPADVGGTSARRAAYLGSARLRVRWALELCPIGDVDGVTRELLEAVKHIDNARKMLREDGGT